MSVGPWLSGFVMRNLVLFWVLEECQAFQTLLALVLWDDENAGEFIRWVYKMVLPRQLVLKYFEYIKLVFPSSTLL